MPGFARKFPASLFELRRTSRHGEAGCGVTYSVKTRKTRFVTPKVD
ncbi:MAG: hypothetical protein BWY59_01336 [Verrucomicrobia bacterium ADurb.Bin345]|nr:MAG: hypothetical protein BWY59_01336 [Verrucomicrobia bacterium ADurb.Bin345]